MTLSETKEMLLFVADRVIEAKPLLTEADKAIGDGDHGIGMALGMTKAKQALADVDAGDINALFKAMGSAMINSMGGASGVIFGTMFSGGVRRAESILELSAESLALIMRGALEMIKQRGGASVGDKTMVDALEPAAAALEENKNKSLCEALDAAANAARAGMESTSGMVARFGRAKSLMERAVGHPDAGAVSVTVIFDAMRDFAAQKVE